MSITKLIENLNQRDFLHALRKACRARHVTLEEVLAKGRRTAMVRAREDCIMLLLNEGLSLTHVGDLLDMDHSAVHAAKERVLARTG